MNSSFAFKVIVTLVVVTSCTSLARATCTWEDKNGVFHMTDDRSHAPRNANCDGEEPTQSPRESVSKSVSKLASTPWTKYKSQFAPGELGYDDEGNRILYDSSRVALDPVFNVERTPYGTHYRVIVPTSIDIFTQSGSVRHSFDIKVECGPLRNHDSGIQTYGRIDLSKEQKRILRENACEVLKP